METFLYNTITQKKEGPTRNGPYMVDGKPGNIPEGWVELTVHQLQNPIYDSETETIEHREYADIQNRLWVKEPYIRELTVQEIEQRKPKPPETCTPRQFRLALLSLDIDINTVESMLENIENENERKIAKVEWEYSLEIKREHPLISNFALQLNISKEKLDEIFIVANTFD